MPLEKARIKTVASEVINIMHERSDGAPNSSITQDFVSTLHAMSRFFQQEVNGNQFQNLTVRVPILGKIHVGRNSREYSVPEVQMTSYQTAQDARG